MDGMKMKFLNILIASFAFFNPLFVRADEINCNESEVPVYVLGDYKSGLQCLSVIDNTAFFCQEAEVKDEKLNFIKKFHYFILKEKKIFEISDSQQFRDSFLVADESSVYFRPSSMDFRSNRVYGTIHREKLVLMLTYKVGDETLPLKLGRCTIEEPRRLLEVLQKKFKSKKSKNKF